MKIIPGGNFLVVEEYETDYNANTAKVIISGVTTEEEYKPWIVTATGEDVEIERLAKGDLVLAQPSHVNTIRALGQSFYYVDKDFCIKFVEE